MTKQEIIEDLQDKVSKNYITNISELMKYEPDIDIYDDVLSPIEFNICDECGELYRSNELCWVDYLDPEYDSELIDKLSEKDGSICAICDDCVNKIKGVK